MFSTLAVLGFLVASCGQDAALLTSQAGAQNHLSGTKDHLTVKVDDFLITQIFGLELQADELLRRGGTYFELGDWQSAQESWHEALAIYQQIRDIPGEAAALGNLGLVYRELGDYISAINFLTQSLDRNRDIRHTQGTALAYQYLGETYVLIGSYPQAEQFLNLALTITETIQNPSLQSATLMGLGNLQASQGRFVEAFDDYQSSLAISEEIGDHSMQGSALVSLGIVYHALDELEASIEHLLQGLRIARQYDLQNLEQAALSSLGLAYAAKGEYTKAIENGEEALRFSRINQDGMQIATSLNNLGYISLKATDLVSAERYLRASIDAWNAIADEFTDEHQLNIRDTLIPFDLLLQVLVEQGRYEDALEIAEQSRARASLNLLASRDAESAEALVIDRNEGLTISQIKAVAREQDATIVEYAVVLDTELSFGKFRGQAGSIYIWVISPSGEITFQKVSLADAAVPLEDRVRLTFQSLGARHRSRGGFAVVENSNQSQSQQLQVLYELLIEPIEDWLPTQTEERIIVIPHRDLSMVPFAALQDSENTYLIEKYTLTNAPSIQLLDWTQQQRPDKDTEVMSASNFLVVGNPEMPSIQLSPDEPTQPLPSLSGAEQEAIAIANFLDVPALVDHQATEFTVKARLPSASLIHLATHGLLEYGRPEDSGVRDIPGAIALTPDEQEDGLLTAAEILEMQLQADLVVLSACDTGLGEITDDGVNGLSRSFIMAGVPSVVVSLWSVPDAPTAQLMTEFYRQLQQGHDKASALRHAMLATKATHPNPRDWAAFILVGVAD